MAAAARATADPPHIPVLLGPLLKAVAPVSGLWLDGTFGAGGYARGLLDAGADRVIGLDRDPAALAMARGWAAQLGDRLTLVQGTFGRLDEFAPQPLDGVVLDLGVSSMQIDQAERGFSFMRDGPLDMRMGGEGPTAADIVNTASEAELADILFHYGEERAARRIARAILRARAQGPIKRTLQLVKIVEENVSRAKHSAQQQPAARSFQALRIAVNDEYGELAAGLEAAERALKPGGKLAVVTFHSIEDRMVKRFLAQASDAGGQGSRHAPAAPAADPRFEPLTRRAVTADPAEVAANPRARSAKLRAAIRTAAPAQAADRAALGMPQLPHQGVKR